MFLNPRKAIEAGWIKFPAWVAEPDYEKYIQPNAIDFTIDRMFAPSDLTVVKLPFVFEDRKQMPTYDSVEPNEDTGTLKMQSNIVYDALSDFYVEVPQGVAATLIIRSSFARCGVRLASGLYDSGFKGNIGCTLINHGLTDFFTKPGTRIGQIAFHASDSAKEYAGGWNHANGTDWKDVKYK